MTSIFNRTLYVLFMGDEAEAVFFDKREAVEMGIGYVEAGKPMRLAAYRCETVYDY